MTSLDLQSDRLEKGIMGHAAVGDLNDRLMTFTKSLMEVSTRGELSLLDFAFGLSVLDSSAKCVFAEGADWRNQTNVCECEVERRKR